MTGQRFVRSIAFYPVTSTYLGAVAAIICVSAGWLSVGAGLVTLLVVAVLAVVWSMRTEVTKVHKLVNSQHDELVSTIGQMGRRIDQLITALVDADEPIPEPQSGMKEEGRGPRPAGES